MNTELEKLIDFAIADGNLTDKKKELVLTFQTINHARKRLKNSDQRHNSLLRIHDRGE